MFPITFVLVRVQSKVQRLLHYLFQTSSDELRGTLAQLNQPKMCENQKYV